MRTRTAAVAARKAGRATRAVAATSAIALLALAGTSTAASAFELSGQSCRESIVTFAVPADRADDALPDGWTPYTNLAGQAVVGVGVLACESLQIKGKPTDDRMLSDVGILVVSPEGDDPAWYLLWQHSSSEHLRAAMAELGVAGKRAKLDDAWAAGLLGRVSATVDAPTGDYELSATRLSSEPVVDSSPVWWHDGLHGRIKLTYRVLGTWAAAGPGRLRAQPGTALAGLAGTEREAAGAFLTIDRLTATAERWPSGA